jgi:hypothetical protein
MELKKFTEIKLDIRDTNIVFTILTMGGWHKGRCVDISEVDRHYQNNGVKLNEPASKFFKEFYNITPQFCFKYKNRISEKWSIGGGELYFDTTLSNDIFPTTDEDKEDFNSEKSLVAKNEPSGFVPIADSGLHLGGTLWIGDSGKYYRTYYYSLDTIECYDSVFEIFEHDLKFFTENSSELFVSLEGYAKEWGIGGDYYLKKYLELYGDKESTNPATDG